MKTRYAKLPKKLRLSKKNPAVFRLVGEVYYGRMFFGFLKYPLWLLSPICLLQGHTNKTIYPYGLKVKQCQRCSKVFYKKPIKNEGNLYNGEVGQLYGVRFTSTKNDITK